MANTPRTTSNEDEAAIDNLLRVAEAGLTIDEGNQASVSHYCTIGTIHAVLFYYLLSFGMNLGAKTAKEGLNGNANDPTGLDDLKNLETRVDQGEGASEAVEGGDITSVNMAKVAYEEIFDILREPRDDTRTRMIILRAIDKIFHAWNKEVEAGALESQESGDADQEAEPPIMRFTKSGLNAVDPEDEQEDDDVYYLTGRALVGVLEQFGCTTDILKGIETSVVSVRDKLTEDVESVREKIAEAVSKVERSILALENTKLLDEAPKNAMLTDLAMEDAATAAKRGNYGSDGHQTGSWTDAQDFELLKIRRRTPTPSWQETADALNAIFPALPPRTKDAVRFQAKKLKKKNVNVFTCVQSQSMLRAGKLE